MFLIILALFFVIGVSPPVLIGASLSVLIGASPPAQSEDLYFVSVAVIAKGQQAKYERFLKEVAPIWKKHKMEVIARVRVVDSTSVRAVEGAPHEIGILKTSSRANFNSYLADPAYQEIKKIRLESTRLFVVLEGSATQTAALKYLPNVPMAAIVLSTEKTKPSKASLTIQVKYVGQVQGTIVPFLNAVKSVQIHAVSFDDNPMGYMPDDRTRGQAQGLVGELVR